MPFRMIAILGFEQWNVNSERKIDTTVCLDKKPFWGWSKKEKPFKVEINAL